METMLCSKPLQHSTASNTSSSLLLQGRCVSWAQLNLAPSCGWVQGGSSPSVLEPQLQEQYHLGKPLGGVGEAQEPTQTAEAHLRPLPMSTNIPLAKASQRPSPSSGKGSKHTPPRVEGGEEKILVGQQPNQSHTPRTDTLYTYTRTLYP